MKGHDWWAFGLHFQVAVRWNNWALPIGVNWGTEYHYSEIQVGEYIQSAPRRPEYRWFGIDIGPFAFTAFRDHELERVS